VGEPHKLGMRITIQSEAILKWWRIKIGKVSTLIEHEPYSLVVGLRNLAKRDFPKGRIELVVLWASERKTYRELKIPTLSVGEKWEKEILPEDTVGSTGMALVFCSSVTAEDKNAVTLWNWSGSSQHKTGVATKFAISDFHSITWTDFYIRYTAVFSAIALMIIAIQAIVAFLVWVAGALARLFN